MRNDSTAQHALPAAFSHQPWVQLLSGLIPEIVTVLASQLQLALAATLLLQNCIRNDLRRSRDPKFPWGTMPPDPPRRCTCSCTLTSNHYVTYLFNNLHTGLYDSWFVHYYNHAVQRKRHFVETSPIHDKRDTAASQNDTQNLAYISQFFL